MADSSVSFLLDKLSSLLEAEVKLQRGVREDVQHIKYELEGYKGILRVADALEDKNPELKAWVKRVRDVAHDMEDAIDEFSLGLVDQHGQGNNSSFHMNFFTRHKIASNIQGIKSRLDIISQKRPDIPWIGSGSSQRLSSRLDSQGDALLLEEADLVGIDKPKKQLSDLLFNEEAGRAVIPVYGMGGLGKTTLAKQVYDDPKVKKRFRIHAWINVSQSFKLDELLKDLVQQLHTVIGKPAPEAVGQMKSDQLKEVIKNLLQRSRYLVVLDDVWQVKVWDSVKLALPNNNRGSRVMLTTRKKDIALHSCAELGKDFDLEFLPEEEAWYLFCKKTFQDNSLENFSIRALCSTGYKLLRVLDLQDAPLEVFPAEIVSLYLLKYLSLKNTKVKSIPGSIKKLQQLETLDLKHTHVTVLPVEIVELQRLRHLLVYRYEIESYANLHSRHGFKVAAPIGLMQSLQKLCFIEADQALMIELGKLTRLRRLGIRKMRKQDGAALCSSIEKMINLRSLSITAIEEDEIIDIHNIFRPPQYLHQLYLSGRLDNFPHWISSLKNLRCDSLKQVPLGIEHLTKLKSIELFDMPEEFITALRPNGGEDYWRVQQVPAVYISYWRDRGWDVYSLETLGERESDSSGGTAIRSLEICTLWKV
ncbi:hypothetical protein JHK87_025710 [Glycine soja]|nr:hypothetical protein JHK87_025710 [Glycine soja]